MKFPRTLLRCANLRTNEGQNFKLMDTREEKDVFFDLILVLDVTEHLEDYFSARPLVAAEIRGGVSGAEVRTTEKPNRRRRPADEGRVGFKRRAAFLILRRFLSLRCNGDC